jgi:hypothetical protein
MRDDVGEAREPLMPVPVSVDDDELAPRRDEVAELGLGDAARLVAGHTEVKQLLGAALDVESQLVVDVLLDGPVRHSRGAADSGDAWLVRHRRPPTCSRSGPERVPRHTAPIASTRRGARRGRAR